MKIRFYLSVLALVALAFPSFAATERSYPSTALALLLAEQPTADLKDARVQERLQSLEKEVRFLFGQVLTTDGERAFLEPSPVVFGMLLISFDKPTDAKLRALAGSEKIIDLTKESTGIDALDALTKKYGATALRAERLWFQVDLPKDVNPNLAALDYKQVSGVRWAEGNHVFNFGGRGPLQRLSGNPVLYRFTVGWGDCPAGCIAHHNWLFEVYGDRAVKKVGESGNPLPAQGEGSQARGYFKE